jgi:hypothetical protein
VSKQKSWKRCFMYCIAGLACSVYVRAQDPQPCTDMNSVIGYKILLDDIRFNSSSTDAQQKQLMELLNFQLQNRLENLDEEPTARYHLIRCNGKFPRDEASFPPTTMQGLVNRDVVLEVWGEIFAPSGGKHNVFVKYAMVPLFTASISPFLQRQYHPKVGSTPDEMAEWLANLDELDTYAMVARAVRLLSLEGPKAYDSANRDLGTASDALRRAFGASPTPPQKQLLTFLRAQKCEILANARSHADYHGPLQHLPDAVVAQECPAGGVQ